MDTPETLAAAMLKAAGGATAAAYASVEVGANHIKRDWRANVAKTAPVRNAHAQYAITYDKPSAGIAFGSMTIGTEIGYDKDINGGPLGNLLEFGGGGDHSPPHRDGGRALDVEEPRFEAAIAAAAEKLL